MAKKAIVHNITTTEALKVEGIVNLADGTLHIVTDEVVTDKKLTSLFDPFDAAKVSITIQSKNVDEIED